MSAVDRAERGDQRSPACSRSFLTRGPGYRVYFGKDGDTIVILLVGGTTKRQSRDIEVAQDHWQHKMRKR